jgi:fluoroacetyl-CoA thioesterase
MQIENLIGAVGISQMVVRPGDTALAHGSGDMAILSTSFLVTLMESACNSAIAEMLENGESSVTSTIEMEIKSPVGIGSEIQGAATCTAIEDGNLRFAFEIHDGDRLIATGNVSRKLVDRVTYLAKSAALTVMSQQAPRD